jgi:uncharacterized protein YjbJ (UPF0337 family)
VSLVDFGEEAETRAHRLRGRIKRTDGRVTGDRTLQAGGRAEQASTTLTLWVPKVGLSP